MKNITAIEKLVEMGMSRRTATRVVLQSQRQAKALEIIRKLIQKNTK